MSFSDPWCSRQASSSDQSLAVYVKGMQKNDSDEMVLLCSQNTYYATGTLKIHLHEMVLLRTKNIYFDK